MRTSVFFALLAISAGAVAQSPAQFADNAKKVTAQRQEQVEVVETEGTIPGKPSKLSYRLVGTAWNVKEAGSSLKPAQATVRTTLVRVTVFSYSTPPDTEPVEYVTKDSARVELTYAPSAKGWKFSGGRIHWDERKAWLPLEHGNCAKAKDYLCSTVEAFEVTK